jgi:hypothetical protein
MEIWQGIPPTRVLQIHYNYMDKTEARVAPGSVQLYSKVVLHATSMAACQTNIPQKKRGFLSTTPFIQNFDFLIEEVIWE